MRSPLPPHQLRGVDHVFGRERTLIRAGLGVKEVGIVQCVFLSFVREPLQGGQVTLTGQAGNPYRAGREQGKEKTVGNAARPIPLHFDQCNFSERPVDACPGSEADRVPYGSSFHSLWYSQLPPPQSPSSRPKRGAGGGVKCNNFLLFPVPCSLLPDLPI